MGNNRPPAAFAPAFPIVGDKTYNEPQAARMLGATERTLRRWRAAGRVPFHATPGGRIRYTIDDLAAIQSGMRRPARIPEQ